MTEAVRQVLVCGCRWLLLQPSATNRGVVRPWDGMRSGVLLVKPSGVRLKGGVGASRAADGAQ